VLKRKKEGSVKEYGSVWVREFKSLVGVHGFSVSFSLELGHLATRTLGIYYKL
jgi:hypothetical protein